MKSAWKRRGLALVFALSLVGSSVPSTALTAENPPSEVVVVANRDSGGVALRDQPTLDAEIVALLDDGTAVAMVTPEMTDDDGIAWIEVATQNGMTGFLPAGLVQATPEPQAGDTALAADSVSAPVAEAAVLAQRNTMPVSSPPPLVDTRPVSSAAQNPRPTPSPTARPRVALATQMTPTPLPRQDARPALAAAVAMPTTTPTRAAVPSTSAQPSLPLTSLSVRSAAAKHPKLESALSAINGALLQRGYLAAQAEADLRDVKIANNAVRVVILGSTDATQAQATVATAGGTLHGGYADLTEASVPLASLDKLAADSSVRWVRQPIKAYPMAVSQGVAASGANVWQTAGFRGSGARVLVLDGGFQGYLNSIATGDLPQPAGLFNFGCSNFQGITHGTQVAEIVHGMAPDATLYLACHGGDVSARGVIDGVISSGQAKDQAKALHVDIIQQSEGWAYDSRGDGTGGPGTMDSIVADARANGILWVASAGNSATAHWSGTYSDPNNNFWHNFSGADEINAITPGFSIAPGRDVYVSLSWNEWPASGQDYDLYLVNAISGLVLARSENMQTGTQPPTESLGWINTTGSPVAVGVSIRDFNKATGRASTTPRMDMFVWPAYGGIQNFQYGSTAGSVLSPAYSSSAMAVGAVCWQNNRLEDYSSRGPVFDGRMKPDIAGPTDVNTSLTTWQSCPANVSGVGGFSGTSAAAPHVSGAAALVKGAFPNFTPAQVQQFLESRALDLGTPGKDPLFGSGVLSLGAPPVGVICTPRPAVNVQAVNIGGGLLRTTITASGAANTLHSLQFGLASNALIDIPGGAIGAPGSFDVALPGGTVQSTFYVRHAASGATTVPLIVVDACGAWPTFVGGGPTAF